MLSVVRCGVLPVSLPICKRIPRPLAEPLQKPAKPAGISGATAERGWPGGRGRIVPVLWHGGSNAEQIRNLFPICRPTSQHSADSATVNLFSYSPSPWVKCCTRVQLLPEFRERFRRFLRDLSAPPAVPICSLRGEHSRRSIGQIAQRPTPYAKPADTLEEQTAGVLLSANPSDCTCPRGANFL